MGRRRRLAEEGKLHKGAVAFARRLMAEKAPLRKVRDRSDKLEARAATRKSSTPSARPTRGNSAVLRRGRRRSNRSRTPSICRSTRGPKERADVHGAAGDDPVQGAAPCVFRRAASGQDPDIGPDVPTRPIRSVGVIGAGTMGGGIAMNFLDGGHSRDDRRDVERGARPRRSIMRRNYENTAKKGRLTRPTSTSGWAAQRRRSTCALAQADLVIEAVFENMDVKKTSSSGSTRSPSPARSSPPTPPSSISTRSRRRPSGPRTSSACISSRPPM